MITLSDEQQDALGAINDFIESPHQIFVLHGLAGTGKTTLLSQIANEQSLKRTTELVSFTGKAASVLAMKAAYHAKTIHSLFYKLIEKGEDDKGKRVLVFQRVFQPGALKGSLVLVDESSMVSDQIGHDLKSSGAKIIACGDYGQLQPVLGKQYFTKADFTLKHIHRQALESPIIRQAHSVRETGRYKADGENFRITNQITPDNLREYDTVLCWTNKTRVAFNSIIREIRGHTKKYPQQGETIMCLKNARDFGIFNGAVYTLTRPIEGGDKSVYIEMDGEELKVPNCVFVNPGETVDKYDNKKIISAFDYGYCLTVHKSQGSEWKKVILIDEYSRDDERRNWLYTAFTRASEKVLIQS
jgi:exodeoxyribonuclease-5